MHINTINLPQDYLDNEKKMFFLSYFLIRQQKYSASYNSGFPD